MPGSSDRWAGFKDTAAIGREVVEELRSRVGVSACLFLPLANGAQDLSGVVAASDEIPPGELVVGAARMSSQTVRDLGTPEHYLAQPHKTVDFDRQFGRERLEGLATYNEFWRPCRIERQVVGFMGTAEDPLGAVCMARRARDRAFTLAEARVLERLRRGAERALARLRREAAVTTGVGAMLAALETGLPVSCALFDAGGRLLWISRQALTRFESEAPRIGRARILFEGCAEYETWRRAAMEAARDRSQDAAAPLMRVEAPGGTRPVCVRRLFPPLGVPLVLVSALPSARDATTAPNPADLGPYRLTQREAEVAVLAARGFSVLNVAAQLAIAESTVRTHVKNAYRKMQVSNRAELTARVIGAVVGLTGSGGGTGGGLGAGPDGPPDRD
ncbi:MAG: helix-turn-helix transcriptional regulator [Deltaproteobacteria bacterium]|nr:helix-turn-helix transcriptional regulator [Deltaproteobacteria bacterium]